MTIHRSIEAALSGALRLSAPQVLLRVYWYLLFSIWKHGIIHQIVFGYFDSKIFLQYITI